MHQKESFLKYLGVANRTHVVFTEYHGCNEQLINHIVRQHFELFSQLCDTSSVVPLSTLKHVIRIIRSPKYSQRKRRDGEMKARFRLFRTTRMIPRTGSIFLPNIEKIVWPRRQVLDPILESINLYREVDPL